MTKEELEKEAEEYYYKTYHVTLNIGEEERKKEVTDIFIKGAEFGYNKAKQEDKVELDFMERACDGAAEMYDDLKTAKGIIQSFVWWHTGEDRGSIDSNDLVERAKQLLKEHEL